MQANFNLWWTNDLADVPLDPLPPCTALETRPEKTTGTVTQYKKENVSIKDKYNDQSSHLGSWGLPYLRHWCMLRDLLWWHRRQLWSNQRGCNAAGVIWGQHACNWEPNPKWCGWLEHYSESQVTKYKQQVLSWKQCVSRLFICSSMVFSWSCGSQNKAALWSMKHLSIYLMIENEWIDGWINIYLHLVGQVCFQLLFSTL